VDSVAAWREFDAAKTDRALLEMVERNTQAKLIEDLLEHLTVTTGKLNLTLGRSL